MKKSSNTKAPHQKQGSSNLLLEEFEVSGAPVKTITTTPNPDQLLTKLTQPNCQKKCTISFFFFLLLKKGRLPHAASSSFGCVWSTGSLTTLRSPTNDPESLFAGSSRGAQLLIYPLDGRTVPLYWARSSSSTKHAASRGTHMEQ